MPNIAPKIALIGAGPTSLTLAALLHAQSIPFTIYEASPSIRHAGGTLDLHPATGQQALREAGLYSSFLKYARPEGDVVKLVDPRTGEVVWDGNAVTQDDSGSGSEEERHQRPEIDRARLVQILHESLPKGRIEFGKKLVRAVQSASPTEGNGKITYDLHFEDGSSVTGVDILVGGDGTWSIVRRLLSDQTPQYSGISALEVWMNDTKANVWADDYAGAGSLFSFGEGLSVLCQRQGNGSLRSYACLRVPENFIETCGIDWANLDEARSQWVDTYLNHISPDLQHLVKESVDNAIPRKMYELPVGWKWLSRSGVTLIGDAAHVMTPFAGVGVNVGMTDALVLAREIKKVCEGEKDIDEALQAYEAEMFPRAEANAAKTARNKIIHFRDGGCQHMIKMMHPEAH